MVRTQVQLTGPQLRALRDLSSSSGRSIADIVRQGVDLYLSTQLHAAREDRVRRALAVAGKFASSSSDGSAHHDRHLAGAFRA